MVKVEVVEKAKIVLITNLIIKLFNYLIMKSYRSSLIVVLLLFLILTALNIDQNLIVPLLVVLRSEGLIPGDETTWYVYAGLLGTIPAVSGVLTTFIWGYLADRINRTKLLVMSVLIGAIPTFLTSFAGNYNELLVYRSLAGIGISGSAPVSRAFVADIFTPEKRGKGYALISASTGGGTLAGMTLAAILPDWRTTFMIAALPNLILAPIFLIVAKEVKIGYSEPEIKKLYDLGRNYLYKIKLNEFFAYLKQSKTTLFMFLQGIPGTVPWGSIPYWSLSYLNIRWNISKEVAIIALLFAGIGMMIGFFLGGMLTDHLISKGFRNSRILIPFIGIIFGMLILIFLLSYPYPVGSNEVQDILPLSLIALLGFLFASLASSNVPAVLSEISLPEHRGTLNSIFNITDNIGGAFGPVITASFISYFALTLDESSSMYYGLLTSMLFWIPCAIFWLPALKTYKGEVINLRKILKSRAEVKN